MILAGQFVHYNKPAVRTWANQVYKPANAPQGAVRRICSILGHIRRIWSRRGLIICYAIVFSLEALV
jgi:hypothetical protein